MVAEDNAGKDNSERNMEGDEGSWTVECLRGRLLAERTASRIAKQNADLMAKKLMQIETQFKQEVKSKNRAERKLKSLIQKLEDSKIPYDLAGSEHPSLAETSETTAGSSTASSSATKHQTEILPQTLALISSDKSTIDELSREDDHNREDGVCNSLTLVLSCFPAASSPVKAEKIEEDSVGDVLTALQRAREEIRKSLQRTHQMTGVPLIKA